MSTTGEKKCVEMLCTCAAHSHHGQDVLSCVQFMNLASVCAIIAQVPQLVLVCLLYPLIMQSQVVKVIAKRPRARAKAMPRAMARPLARLQPLPKSRQGQGHAHQYQGGHGSRSMLHNETCCKQWCQELGDKKGSLVMAWPRMAPKLLGIC